MNVFRTLLLIATLVASLAGCGPGVGGTGTGDSTTDLAAFGATAQPLCDAPFAQQLACPPISSPGEAPAVNGGTRAVSYVDMASGGRFVVGFEGDSVELDARCLGLRFTGDWGVTGSGDARFYGSVAGADGSGREAATLAVSAVTGATGELQLVLRLADGSVIVGPLVVRPAAVPSPLPPACS